MSETSHLLVCLGARGCTTIIYKLLFSFECLVHHLAFSETAWRCLGAYACQFTNAGSSYTVLTVHRWLAAVIQAHTTLDLLVFSLENLSVTPFDSCPGRKTVLSLLAHLFSHFPFRRFRSASVAKSVFFQHRYSPLQRSAARIHFHYPGKVFASHTLLLDWQADQIMGTVLLATG